MGTQAQASATRSQLTKEQARRIRDGIADCDRFIALEEPRDPALRPADVAQHLAFCKTHKVKLLAMLEGGAA